MGSELCVSCTKVARKLCAAEPAAAYFACLYNPPSWAHSRAAALLPARPIFHGCRCIENDTTAQGTSKCKLISNKVCEKMSAGFTKRAVARYRGRFPHGTDTSRGIVPRAPVTLRNSGKVGALQLMLPGGNPAFAHAVVRWSDSQSLKRGRGHGALGAAGVGSLLLLLVGTVAAENQTCSAEGGCAAQHPLDALMALYHHGGYGGGEDVQEQMDKLGGVKLGCHEGTYGEATMSTVQNSNNLLTLL